MENELPALSVIQPWAWLLTNINPATGQAWKDVENRDWKKAYPPRVLIHASQKFDRDGYEWVRRAFPEIPMPAPDQFERGGIVGQVDFTGCVSKMNSRWFFGRYGYTTANAKPLPFRRCRGALGFFKPDYNCPEPAPKPLKAPREPKAAAPAKATQANQQQSLPGMG